MERDWPTSLGQATSCALAHESEAVSTHLMDALAEASQAV